MSPYPAKSWLDCHSNSFIEIQNIAMVKSNWKSFQKVLNNDKYKNLILKPVNNYVLYLYPKPELISYKEDEIVLRQRTHADIWFYDYKDYRYVLDRPHQRQFYPSKIKNFLPNEHVYPEQFRFYIPWIFDYPCNIEYKNVQDEDTSFLIFEKNITYDYIDHNLQEINTDFISFFIYKQSNYKIDSDYGIIKFGTAMYDIIIKDKNVIKEIIKIYE